MEALKERIRQEGRALPGNIIQVDSFLNHQVDVQFLGRLAEAFAQVYDIRRITKILTAEASGIPLATLGTYRYSVPVVFAKKAKSDNIEGGLYQSEIFSYTYRRKVTLLVSKDWITPKDRVLIVDDFLARGEAMRGLLDIVTQAGAELAGIAVAVEKGFQHGGDKLRQEGYPLCSLAIIDGVDSNGFIFREE